MQVLQREPEVQAYYCQSLDQLQQELSSLLSNAASLPISPNKASEATPKQSASATPASSSRQGLAGDQDAEQQSEAILDEREGMRGSSAEDSDTGDDMDLDEDTPLPSHIIRSALAGQKNGKFWQCVSPSLHSILIEDADIQAQVSGKPQIQLFNSNHNKSRKTGSSIAQFFGGLQF